MARHTTFRFCLDPTVEQQGTLARHAGAARFAFNQSLRLVKTALETKGVDSAAAVPWTGFDLINAFNAWKKTEQAGRVFTVDVTGDAEVFEEAAVDLGRALKSFTDSRTETRRGKRVGFPGSRQRPGQVRRSGCGTDVVRAGARRFASASSRARSSSRPSPGGPDAGGSA
jgi:putative transposase